MLAIEHLVDQSQITIQIIRGLRFQAREHCQGVLQIVQPRFFFRVILVFRHDLIDLALGSVLPAS